ncbi:MAG TPA: hypothetical protein VHD61_06805 [Lacunisphaera sp.]|nr:hypothetical protein [Lacunisphaera sp.]
MEASSRRLHYLALAHLLATFGGANSDARPDASAPADSDIERAR